MPGSPDIERRIKSLVRWNAAAMVVRANKASEGIGGHISTFASAATLYEVGFNHFFRGHDVAAIGDVIFFQGHAAPGIYARAYLEGRIDETQLENFRRELNQGGGLSSYPHPWLMPDFWDYPTRLDGARARSWRSTRRASSATSRIADSSRNPTPRSGRFWATARPTSPNRSAPSRSPAREKLDNLIFVINCNLQRLDGPVRGNGQIIQELEAAFRGAGWNVIKVLWGSEWDPLLAKDRDGLLVKRMGEIVDGQYQKYAVESGAYIREHFWGADPRLLDMVKHLSRRPAEEDDARRPRPDQGLQRLQGGRRAQGRAHRRPRAHHQGLRPRRGGRRQEHHPPAEEAQRRRAARVPYPLRHSDLRRRHRP